MKFITQKIIIAVLILITVVSFIVWGKGYRLSLSENKFVKTGILATTSSPEGAKVSANGKFLGATNTNFTLNEGDYEVSIVKDGLLGWAKKIQIKAEQVQRADPWLFSKNPSLTPQTSVGIKDMFLSPSNEKVFYLTPTSSTDKKAGIYLFGGAKRNFLLSGGDTLILGSEYLGNLEKFKIVSVDFSPEEDEIIIKLLVDGKNVEYLLSASSSNSTPSNVTNSSAVIVKNWNEQKLIKKEKYLKGLPVELEKIANDIFLDFKVSPNGKKILYQAKANFELPPIIVPALIGTNQTPQSRKLQANSLYVLDLEEDKNYLINNIKKIEDIHWFISSAHLINIEKNQSPFNITLRDYDNTNIHVVYNGPILFDKFSVTSDGDILTLLNFASGTASLPDLYLISVH